MYNGQSVAITSMWLNRETNDETQLSIQMPVRLRKRNENDMLFKDSPRSLLTRKAVKN